MSVDVCVECGNDEPCEGYRYCLECLEYLTANGLLAESEPLLSPERSQMSATEALPEEMHRNDERGLEELRALTDDIREAQRLIARKAKRRREVVLRLRDHRVTYRELAEAMGVSEVTVYKVIRGDQ